MDWVIKSYVGRATKELVSRGFFVSFVFESRFVGLRANYAQAVIYGYLPWKLSANDIFLSIDLVGKFMLDEPKKR